MLTVVVPATDAPATLPCCLGALARSDEPHEVVAVTAPAGSGPAAARNAGAAASAGAILVFVDADVEVHPDALRHLREALDRDRGLDAVFGAYDERPRVASVVSRFRNLLHHHVHISSPGPATTFWAGLGAVRREAFCAVGGFDVARYPRPSIEDIDLGMRLHAAGFRIELEPAARGTHLKRWTLRSMLRTDLIARGAPWVALQLERGAGGPSLNLAPRHRLAAGAAVVATAAGIARRPWLALWALAAMTAANAGFYRLLARVGGAQLAFAGIGLHLLHHLTAAASVPAGLLLWARRPPHAAPPAEPASTARATEAPQGAAAEAGAAQPRRTVSQSRATLSSRSTVTWSLLPVPHRIVSRRLSRARIVSLSLPPSMTSAPGPPTSRSAPVPPDSLSLPAPPDSRSRPERPSSLSLPVPPVS